MNNLSAELVSKAEVDCINEQVMQLWRSSGGRTAQSLYPMLYEPWNMGGLLTVGINPAFQVLKAGKTRQRFGFLKGCDHLEHVRKDPEGFYRWPSSPSEESRFNISDSCMVERCARENYKIYFEPCWAIRKETDLHWHHIDMLFVRRTDQASITCSLNRDGSLTEFGESQFRLFKQLLDLGRPEIVVFMNATASRIFQREGERLREVRDHGYDVYRIGLCDVPVLFSGPVGDGFTKNRLAWHAKHSLNHFRESVCPR